MTDHAAIRRVSFYTVVLVTVQIVTWWWQGQPDYRPKHVLAGLLLTPLFAYLIWLRWDWAPQERRRRVAERERAQREL